MLVLGHRGASADAPENTLAAFAEAVAQGADGVELDVRVCGSGEVVVCHDARLDRLAGVPLEVRSTPYAQLRTLDVGSALGFAPAQIPRLEEVFEQLPADFWVNVELKCDRLDDGGLSRKVARLIEDRRLSERVLLSSFNAACLLRVAAAAPRLRRGYLIDPDRSYALQEGVLRRLTANHSVHPHHRQATDARLSRWRAAGLKVAVWTVDDAAEARRLQAAGVDYCITNRPRELLRAIGR